MLTKAIDLGINVCHALQISPPDYARSILGDFESWSTQTCPPTELQLAALHQWSKGLPALAHIIIPAIPWKPPGLTLPFSDLLFRPSSVFRYPAGATARNPTPKQKWFFINGICTDKSVVLLNARYIHKLFGRPLTVVHNFTRGVILDLAACAVGKEWEHVTESAAVAFPPIYAALKSDNCERVILLAHSQGTILSAVVLALLKHLHPPTRARVAMQAAIWPEHAVAQKLAKRWDFARTMRNLRRKDMDTERLPSFVWPGHGRRQPEPVTFEELRKLEIYCFANCATEMSQVSVRATNRRSVPWIESYGNEQDLVARMGVLANAQGPGSVRIGGDRYRRNSAWGHLLNAHYLYPMIETRSFGDPTGGLVSLKSNGSHIPRLFEYLHAKSPPPHSPRDGLRSRTLV